MPNDSVRLIFPNVLIVPPADDERRDEKLVVATPLLQAERDQFAYGRDEAEPCAAACRSIVTADTAQAGTPTPRGGVR
jgi:hypothetical protein